jgi:hypothetical protein
VSVLERLDRMLRERPLTRRGVEAALGLPLREDVASSHPSLRIYRSFRASPPVTKVELRLPVPAAPSSPVGARSFRSDAFVVMELDRRAEPVHSDEVEALFGALSAFGPKVPEGAPRYVRATTRRGPILFGYEPGSEGRLREIIVDAV